MLIGEARAKIRQAIEEGASGTPVIRESQTLESALEEAMRLAKPGDTLLFSPACASFDMFKDFEHRGRVFKAIVHTLDETRSRA